MRRWFHAILVTIVMALLPLVAIGAPPPAASVAPGETPLSVQNEVVRELTQTARQEQAKIDRLDRQLDELTNEIDPGAPSAGDASSPLSGAALMDRMSVLAQEIEDSDEHMAQLQSQSLVQTPDTPAVTQTFEALGEADAADKAELDAIGHEIAGRQAQLQIDAPILQQMVAQNVDSVELEELQAKVAEEQGALTQLEDNYRARLARAASAEASRRDAVAAAERNQTYSSERETERQLNDELQRRQQFQGEYATLQKVYAAREGAYRDVGERLNNERLKLDRVTGELVRQSAILAQIAHS